MSWIEVKAAFTEPPEDPSLYAEIFRRHGIEHTLEEDLALTGCLPDVEGAERVAEHLAGDLRDAGAQRVFLAPLPDQDWSNMWHHFFKPHRVGKKFLIQPSWETLPIDSADVLLILDPGQAFGTGDHATTKLCLELLEELDLCGQRVADLGCGSGILSIAATKLGAIVLATDIDPIAVEVARENAARNGVSLELRVADGLDPLVQGQPWEDDELPLLHPEPRTLNPPPSTARSNLAFDAVLSNIISHTLIRLTGQVAAALKFGGSWIVSGIIDSNWPEVERAANRSGFRLREVRSLDGWVAARFERP